ncbi:MAG: hypothetical protein KJO08_08135 [Gammaproteobacteria bacterium]|nr:hypothetical protein [Gammaproteobacteria bacterium]NNJ83762.1 hypothetical protein [Gammaproteobacteria bacterium]
MVLTGTSVLYADSFWAPTVMTLLGGPKMAAVLHRIDASLVYHYHEDDLEKE